MSSGDHIVLFRRAPAELNRHAIRRFGQTLRDDVSRGAGFTCLVTDDRELRRLNRKFLGKDYPTDVLSFPEPVGQAPSQRLTLSPPSLVFLGELAISADRALDQSFEHGHSLEAEIGILMLHGLLHLMGMDHESDRGKMARAEARWRRRLSLPAGLIERARA